MEHIVQFDWCSSGSDTELFTEEGLENCATERIINNKFRDPRIIVEDIVRTEPLNIDWNKVFKLKRNDGNNGNGLFVPGFRAVPPYPKLSTLSVQQHYQCLKVICASNPKVFTAERIPRPSNLDHKVFEEVKAAYLKEQKEYIEWAKLLWTTKHNIRALRPKPTTETVYEAEFKMRASSLQSFPKNFQMAAHISMHNKENNCVINFKQDLVTVNTAVLPKVKYPDPINKKFTIMQTIPVPEPCNKHPCWFILPSEKEMTVLPLTEIHRELAQYALDNGAHIIASERALKCLVETDRYWTIPLAVCEAFTPDGEKQNVLVMGSEFSNNKMSAMDRTYKAFRHLLEYALIPISEQAKFHNEENLPGVASCSGIKNNTHKSRTQNTVDIDFTCSSDEDDDLLVINEDSFDEPLINLTKPARNKCTEENNKDKQEQDSPTSKTPTRRDSGYYNCSCKDSMFAKPPARSYTKWELRNYANGDKFDMIVHCSHKMKVKDDEEIITEPIVEYQIDLGASKQSEERVKSSALSLCLRKNKASLLNVRVDSSSGEVVTIDKLRLDDLMRDTDIMLDITSTVYETLYQLQSLLPGSYVLQHEINHGANALLYASQATGGQKLHLDFNFAELAEADEAKSVKNPPVLTDILLPIHKYRKILPCAFSPFERMLAKEPKKPPTKKTAPPQALRWPKRKKNKKKKTRSPY